MLFVWVKDSDDGNGENDERREKRIKKQVFFLSNQSLNQRNKIN